ncbi:MAG: transporter substrate-binding domain-containing protein [Hyphomicrobiales bacterium]|nr:transporter substrate-binding domain-containing protein [Hyphomicrobiales bacterium]
MFLPRLSCAIAFAGLAMLFLSAADAQERLIIGTEGAYPPFNNLTADGELVGFDIDIAKALCSRMTVACDFVAVDWEGLIPALQAGKIDVIAASLTITEERRKHVLFTRKYYGTPLAIVARNEAGLATTEAAALAGKALGVQAATWQADFAAGTFGKAGALLKSYPSQTEAMIDLSNGRLDAVLSDKIQLIEWMKTEGASCCTMVGDVADTEAEAGLAVRLNEVALRDRLQSALDAIRADGTYDAIRKRYFDFDIYGG